MQSVPGRYPSVVWLNHYSDVKEAGEIPNIMRNPRLGGSREALLFGRGKVRGIYGICRVQRANKQTWKSDFLPESNLKSGIVFTKG